MRYLICCLSLLWCLPARSQSIELLAQPLRPYVYEENGWAAGPAVEVARELTLAAGLGGRFLLAPLPRLLRSLEDGRRIGVFLGRTPEREVLVQWVAPFAREEGRFVTRRGSPKVDTLEQTIPLGPIAVMRGSAAERWLRQNSAPLSDASPDEATNLAKLMAGRVDVWLAPSAALPTLLQQAGIPADHVSVGAAVFGVDLYIVASPDVPPSIIRVMRQRFDQLTASGELARIMAATP